MQTTIIKCHPGSQRGKLRGYTITIIRDGARCVHTVIAENGMKAVQAAARAMGDTAPKVAA